MKFGLPTLVECKDLRACVENASRLGLSFVEINMSFPQYDAAHLDVREAVQLAEAYGVFYTIHADEQLNPFDFNAKVSHCYFDVMRDTIRTAKAIGASVINLHLQKGIYVTLPERVILLSDVYKDIYLSRVSDFARMCEEQIGDAPIRIAIENVDSNPFTVSQEQALREIFFQSPVFGLTLDVGHEDCLGGKDTHVFDAYPDRLCHMHLHDSDGKHPHLALGQGRLPLAQKLSRLSEEDTCLIEVKTLAGLCESVKYLQDHHFM